MHAESVKTGRNLKSTTLQSKPPHETQTHRKKSAHAFAEAFTDFLTLSLLCFFSTMTLNLSKSLNALLDWTAANFFAHADESHFETVSCFSRNFLMTPEPAARGRPFTRRGVRVRYL